MEDVQCYSNSCERPGRSQLFSGVGEDQGVLGFLDPGQLEDDEQQGINWC